MNFNSCKGNKPKIIGSESVSHHVFFLIHKLENPFETSWPTKMWRWILKNIPCLPSQWISLYTSKTLYTYIMSSFLHAFYKGRVYDKELLWKQSFQWGLGEMSTHLGGTNEGMREQKYESYRESLKSIELIASGAQLFPLYITTVGDCILE